MGNLIIGCCGASLVRLFLPTLAAVNVTDSATTTPGNTVVVSTSVFVYLYILIPNVFSN